MDINDVDCPNCGDLVEIETWTDGECERCGKRYFWQNLYDDETGEDSLDATLIWE